MEKKRVYQILDGELLYQEDKWTDANIEHGIPDDEKPVAEWVNFMEYHMNKAKEAIYHLDTTEALAQVRKVTALGVRTMMTNGCPEREGFTESEKRVFMIPIGDNIPEEEIEAYIKKIAEKYKKDVSIDELNKFDLTSFSSDVFVPVKLEEVKSLRPYAEPDPDHVCSCPMDNGTCGCGHDD